MLTIGVDSHKDSLTAIAIDSIGREVGAKRVQNTPGGRDRLLKWASSLGHDECRWGIEGSGMYGRPLAQQLVRADAPVYEVPGLATSRERQGGQSARFDTNPRALGPGIRCGARGDRAPRPIPVRPCGTWLNQHR